MKHSCFEYDDYKKYLKIWISSQPGGGRGFYRKMAQHLKIHTTLMSHIMSGKQDFTEDQMLLLSEFMGLSEAETEYWIELLRWSRASTPRLKERLKRKLQQLRQDSREIHKRIVTHHELTDQDSARFYSNWYFSALRLLTDIPQYQTRASLMSSLPLPAQTLGEAISFLVNTGLIREEKGRLIIGPSQTHLPSNSPYVWTTHKNWRLKAMERHAQVRDQELFYTGPMSISIDDVEKIRELLVQTIAEITKIASTSKPETLVALGVDWFGVR